MAMKITMKMEKKSKMKMMSTEKKKMIIWMNKEKMIWIIVKLCMEMRMMSKIYNNQINNMRIWKKEENLNKLFHKWMRILYLKKMIDHKFNQIKDNKLKLKKIKMSRNKTICRKNIFNLFKISYNKKLKS